MASRIGSLIGIAALVAGCTTQPAIPPPHASLEADPPPTENGAMPGAAAGDLDRGLEYVKNEAYAQALPYLDKAVAEAPNDADAVYYLALCQDKTGKRKEAEAGYQRALSLNPKLVNARINLGAMYLEEPPEPKKAIAALEPAVALEPDASDLHMNLAYAYRLDQQLDKAAEHYRAVLKAEDNPDVRFMLVEVLSDAGKTEDMVAELNKLLVRYEKDVKRVAFIGMRFAKAHAFSECVDTFNKAIKIDGKDPNLWLNRGICRHELKQNEDQIQDDYRKAIDLDAKFQPGWYYLGMSYAGMKKRTNAVDALERCFKINEDTPVGKKAKEKWEALIREAGGNPSAKHKGK